MGLTCEIQLDANADDVYYAGQVMTGKINLIVDKLKQVKAVNLKINGFAHTRWKRRNSSKQDTTYSGHVDYIKTVTCLLVPKATDEAVVIEPGIYTFNFACHIPANCPSSFEGYHGHIRYCIQVSLERPWKFDQTFTKTFTVLAIKNLNYDSPLLKVPVKSDVTKNFCCGPFKSDPLQIIMQISQTGFVPGEFIPVNISVKNDTMTHINEIRVRLVMMNKYFCTNQTKSISEIKTISKLLGDPVQRCCTKEFNYLLPVPATPSTCTTLCSIIQITYRVEVEAKMQGIFYRNQCVHTPVTIGNIPLESGKAVVQEQPIFKKTNDEHALKDFGVVLNKTDYVTSNENIEPWSIIKNLSAPVYMEAADMPDDKLAEKTAAHEINNQTFKPKYPIYNVHKPNSLLPDETDGSTVPSTNSDKTTWL